MDNQSRKFKRKIKMRAKRKFLKGLLIFIIFAKIRNFI